MVFEVAAIEGNVDRRRFSDTSRDLVHQCAPDKVHSRSASKDLGMRSQMDFLARRRRSD